MMPLLLSLKPRFAELVFMGEKTVELRRRIASTMAGREVFIYVSSPVRMIRGGFRVAEVWSSDPETVWGAVASRRVSPRPNTTPTTKAVASHTHWPCRTCGHTRLP